MSDVDRLQSLLREQGRRLAIASERLERLERMLAENPAWCIDLVPDNGYCRLIVPAAEDMLDDFPKHFNLRHANGKADYLLIHELLHAARSYDHAHIKGEIRGYDPAEGQETIIRPQAPAPRGEPRRGETRRP